jgi:hypothetical protein
MRQGHQNFSSGQILAVRALQYRCYRQLMNLDAIALLRPVVGPGSR